MSDAGGDVEAVAEFATEPDSALCALIVVAQDVHNFRRDFVHQHRLPHGLAAHTVEGSREVDKNRNERLAASNYSYNYGLKITQLLCHQRNV